MRVLALLALLLAVAAPARADTPTLRIAVLKFGTVNWLMETIRAEGLDRATGFELEVVPLAGKAATSIAFQARDVQVIVGDWFWALRQNEHAGERLRFAPYSSALGAFMTREPMADICALRGRPVGVVGGETDKSWLVMQGLAAERCGFDLAGETQALYGAPPLMSRQLTGGQVDAVLTYWPFVARLEAEGAVRLIGVDAALAGIGIDRAPPLVGFLWRDGDLDPALRDAFLTAAARAEAMLATEDAAWERLRPLMRAESEAAFLALRDAYRAGIPEPWTEADTEAAARLHARLLALGGPAFAAEQGAFDAQVFHRAEPTADHDG